MKIAVLCPVHRRPDLIAEQIRNYSIMGDPEFVHILHPSQEGRSSFVNFGDSLSGIADVHCCEESWKTSWKCTMAAFILCTKKLESISGIDYVYIHTDGDLLIKSGMPQWINLHEIGFRAGRYDSNSDWFHSKSLDSDIIYGELRKYLGIKDDEIFFARMEGAFFKKDIWLEIVSLLNKFFPREYFNDINKHWPVEESVIPTIAKHIVKSLPASGNLIYTKELKYPGSRDNDQNCLTVEDVETLRLNAKSFFGAKWFSQNNDDAARQFLKSLESKG